MQVILYMANSERGKAVRYRAAGKKALETIRDIIDDKILNGDKKNER